MGTSHADLGHSCRTTRYLSRAVRGDRARAGPDDRRYATAAELADALQRVHPLDSRNASGRLVESVASVDPKASASMPAATLTLPTVRG